VLFNIGKKYYNILEKNILKILLGSYITVVEIFIFHKKNAEKVPCKKASNTVHRGIMKVMLTLLNSSIYEI